MALISNFGLEIKCAWLLSSLLFINFSLSKFHCLVPSNDLSSNSLNLIISFGFFLVD